MRNNNKKIIQKLSIRTMKQSRMRNLFAVAAICLTTLLFTAVFSMGGQIPRTEILRELAVTDENGYIQADETGRTALKGFYGAGDVRTKSLRQVITAAADGANAAVLAAEDLRRTTEKEV